MYYYKNGYRAVLDLEGNVIIPYGEVQATSYMGLLRTAEGLVDLNGNVVLSAADGWSNISLNDDLKIVNATYNPTYTVYRFTVGGGSAPTEPSEPEEPDEPETSVFTDVPDWCASEVAWAVEQGITNGTNPTTFSPDNTCNTAQILTFLWRAAGEPAPSSDPFPETAGQYYADAAAWAYEEGLIDRFEAGLPCTRAMVVEFLWKLQGSPAVHGESAFTDVADDASYAQAVAWAVGQGITGGVGNNRFAPDSSCTRGQIVTFLYRAFAE